MNTYIKGQFRKKIYASDAGYIIGIFRVKETNDENLENYIERSITFTGYFHELNEIDTYILYGDIVDHERYGEQFQVTSYERCLPVEKDSILSFLTSGIFKGIGEKKAKKIVETLGKDTLQIILEHPNNLILIPTITEKNATTLHEKLKEYEASYETIIQLTEIGFSSRDSMMIYNYYKEQALEIIEKDIYQVIGVIPNLLFKKIDIIALRNGIKENSLIRVKAAIIYMMQELSNSLGHCYFFEEELNTFLPRIISTSIDNDLFEQAMNELQIDTKIMKQKEKYYLCETYEAEVAITKRFRMLNRKVDIKCKDIDREITIMEEEFQIQYNEDQRNAIKNSFLKNFLIITGGPGTGKTTIMKGILELYRRINHYSYNDLETKIALLAPTGRAAKRMSEAANFKASTIHRFLRWNKENNKFQVNEYNRSDAEFVIIDEASMIDCHLMHNLLKGLSVNTKIILVGDYEQLPSVGPGEVLHDLIVSDVLNVSKLEQLYRQGKDSNIIALAYDIRKGITDFNCFNQKEDLTFIECKTNEVKKQIEEISKTYQDLSYKQFQVLAPMYKTINGIDQINESLQEIFNKKNKTKKEIKVYDTIYREGDKVIQLTNMPEENIYNGDIGIINQIITGRKNEITIDFDGNIVKYKKSDFSNFKLAYAISIHKAQGSEFDIVIIPIVKQFHKMLYRKLIYTAITRCKKQLYLIGDKEALNLAISNNQENSRRTSIKNMLVNGINDSN